MDQDDIMVPAEVRAASGESQAAARALQRLGFGVLHIGPTVSVQAPAALWQSTFDVSFDQHERTGDAKAGGNVAFLRPTTDEVQIPASLRHLILEVMFTEPPQLF